MLIKILIGNLAICILLTIIVSALFTKEKIIYLIIAKFRTSKRLLQHHV